MAPCCPVTMGTVASCLPTGSNGLGKLLGRSQLRPRAATRCACAAASCAPQRSKMRMRAACVRAARHQRYPTGTSEEVTQVQRTLRAQSPWPCWTCLSERGGGDKAEWRVGELRLGASCCYYRNIRVFLCVVAPSLARPLADSGLTPTRPRPRAQPQIPLAVGSSSTELRSMVAHTP